MAFEPVAADVAQLQVHRVVQRVHAGVAPEAVQPQAAAGGARAGQFKHLRADLDARAVREHLGLGDGDGQRAAARGVQRLALLEGRLQLQRSRFAGQLGRAQQQPQFAITLLQLRLIGQARGVAVGPGACTLQRVAAACLVRRLADAQVQVGHDQLRHQRAQRGAWCGRAAGRLQHVALGQKHVVEVHRAAVGLALAEGVPVLLHGDAFGLRGQVAHQARAAAIGQLHLGAHHQPVGADRARGITLEALQPPAIGHGLRHQPRVLRVEGIAPEPALGLRARQQRALLGGRAPQQHRGHLQVVEGEHMGQCTVGLRQPAHHAVQRGPAGAQAAGVLRNQQAQQAAVADGLALGRGMAAFAVAGHRGGLQLLRQPFGAFVDPVTAHGGSVAFAAAPANECFRRCLFKKCRTTLSRRPAAGRPQPHAAAATGHQPPAACGAGCRLRRRSCTRRGSAARAPPGR